MVPDATAEYRLGIVGYLACNALVNNASMPSVATHLQILIPMDTLHPNVIA
jgi:hypothetical protein